VKEEAALEGRELEEGEYIPACAESCPTEAITFGDLEDNESKVYELSQSSRASREGEDLGVEPKVIYLAERD
ncbi:MAG: 4Fe-4S dicluster domain-containing protein, partial [bacterium]